MIRALIWKEWHEHKWKLAALTTILLVVQLWALSRDADMAMFSLAAAMMFWWLAGVFLAMGTAATERARGTAVTLQGLPCPAWQVLAIKIAFALVAGIAPLALAVAITWLGTAPTLYDGLGGRTPGQVLLAGAGILTASYLWTLAFGLRQSTEVRVGLVGLGVWLGWAIVTAGLIMLYEYLVYHLNPALYRPLAVEVLVNAGSIVAAMVRWIVGLSPLAWHLNLTAPAPVTLNVAALVAVQLLVSVLLLGVILARAEAWRSPRRERGGAAASTAPSPAAALPRPCRSPWGALAYQQWLEARSWVVAALGLMAVLLGISLMPSLMRGYSADVVHNLTHVSLMIGWFLPVVVAVGTFVGSLQRGVHEFWRTRPIPEGLWFWSKFTVGALCVLATLHLPVILAYALTAGDASGAALAYLLVTPALHLAIYAIAVMFICTVGHAIYASLLALGVTMALLLMPHIEPTLTRFGVFELISAFRTEALGPGDIAYLAYLATLIVLAGGAAAIGRWAVGGPITRMGALAS